jgi:hypothetical protein
MRKSIKKGIIVCAAIVGVVLLFHVILIGLFMGLYNPHSKEQVFLQDTPLGVLTIMKDTGDPLSADYWEFYIDNQLIKKTSIECSNHVDTLSFRGLTLLLSVAQNNGKVSFSVIQANEE